MHQMDNYISPSVPSYLLHMHEPRLWVQSAVLAMFLMVFQTDFLQKRFDHQLWHHLLILSYIEIAWLYVYNIIIRLLILCTWMLSTVVKILHVRHCSNLPCSVHWQAFDNHDTVQHNFRVYIYYDNGVWCDQTYATCCSAANVQLIMSSNSFPAPSV